MQLDLAILKDDRLPMPQQKKPILKYAGGKTWLIDYVGKGIWRRLANTGGRYIEPFLGGGAVALWLSLPDMILSDKSCPIMELYQTLVDGPGEVRAALIKLVSIGVDEDAYYTVRGDVPRTPVGRTARLIYLNRLDYNGLYRVNKAGEFNVPYDKSKKIPKDTMKLFPNLGRFWGIQQAFANAELFSCDFANICRLAGEGDVVLADPPYVSAYDQYTEDGFHDADHARLAEELRIAYEAGATIIANNADSPFVRELYDWAPHILTAAEARAINSDGEGRGGVDCLIITTDLEVLGT